MEDKSNFTTPNKPQISTGLQDFINAMVEEIVLQGNPFDVQKKKWLKKYSEAEGVDFENLVKKLDDFLDMLPEFNRTKSDAIKKMIEMHAFDCYITPEIFNSITSTSILANNYSSLIPYRNGDKFGFCNQDKKVIIPCEYDDALQFSDGLAAVKKNNKWGFIDTKGELVIPCKYYKGSYFVNGVTEVEQFAKKGLINKNGIEIIPLIYDEIISTNDDLVAAKINGKFGYVDRNGNTVIPFTYDSAWEFKEGFAVVQKDEKWGFINKKGQTVVPLKYEFVLPFSEGMAAVKLDNDWGYIDSNGNLVVENKFWQAGSFSEGLACVNFDGKDGFIDKQGQIVIPFKFDFMFGQRFQNGKCCVKLNNKWGLINKQGDIVLEPELTGMYFIYNDYYYVEKNKKWGIIDGTGKIIIPFVYDNLIDFRDGLIAVYDSGVKYYVDLKNVKYVEGVSMQGNRCDEPNFEKVFEIDRGLLSSYFLNNSYEFKEVFENPSILLCNFKIKDIDDIAPAIEKAAKIDSTLFVIAYSIKEKAIEQIVQMKLRENLRIAIIDAPGFGERKLEIFEDIALLVQDMLVKSKEELTFWELNTFSGKLISSTSETLIIPEQPDYDAIKKRIKEIELQIAQSSSDYDKEKMQERIDNLKRTIS